MTSSLSNARHVLRVCRPPSFVGLQPHRRVPARLPIIANLAAPSRNVQSCADSASFPSASLLLRTFRPTTFRSPPASSSFTSVTQHRHGLSSLIPSPCHHRSSHRATTPSSLETSNDKSLRISTDTISSIIYHKARRRRIVETLRARRWASNKANKGTEEAAASSGRDVSKESNTTSESSSSSKQSHAESTTGAGAGAGAGRMIYDRLPNISQHLHRPTKADFLAAATGFWSRLGVHFKWFSIKDMRPFNMDDISAFFSWILLGHVVWIIVGTTTFFSLAIFMVNTVFAQETLAKWIGNYLTKSSGVQVVFESAIVPKWGDGVICFKNVFVSRRHASGIAQVSKGFQNPAASAAAATAAAEKAASSSEDEIDTNFTTFDLSFETVNVTLSFAKWFNGKGLLRDVEIEGIRGVVDRRSVQPTPPDVDPRSYRHEHDTGDFELESFKMQDLLVTVYQPGDFRPFPVSIYSCDLPQLRKQWLFYDFLSANIVSGSFDDSLFTIHPRQKHNYSGAHPGDTVESDIATHWKRHSRIRIDGLNIDHLNRGVEGPFGWISEGHVDILADLMIPAEDDESIAKVLSDVYDRVEASVTSNLQNYNSNHTISDAEGGTVTTTTTEPEAVAAAEQTAALAKPAIAKDERFIILDLKINLTDVRAKVPIFTRDISYVNNALIRPIVAYINSNRGALIPVSCRVVKAANEFDGSWTVFDSGLMNDMSRETYDAFARSVIDEQNRLRRFKKVGMWTLQLAAQALFVGLAGNFA